MFQSNVLLSSSGSKSKQSKKPEKTGNRICLQILKMEAISYSDTSMYFSTKLHGVTTQTILLFRIFTGISRHTGKSSEEKCFSILYSNRAGITQSVK
jgi:hypothetical protein